MLPNLTIAGELRALRTELKQVRTELKEIKQTVERIERSTCKMDSHVDFVNGAYERVRAPFNYVIDRINRFGASEHTLPALEDETFLIEDRTSVRSNRA